MNEAMKIVAEPQIQSEITHEKQNRQSKDTQASTRDSIIEKMMTRRRLECE